MKKTVWTSSSHGTKTHFELEILLDANRELTDNDKNALREHADAITRSIFAETKRLDPATKVEADENKRDILSVFVGRAIYVEEIPNGYCGDYCCKHLPWFIVTTTKGRFRIGWRKRVIHIEWTDTTIKEDAKTLFPDEDVTRFDKVIHAWGTEKAQEYINKLLS